MERKNIENQKNMITTWFGFEHVYCVHEYGAIVSLIRQHQHTGQISAGTFSHMHLEIL